MICSNCKYNQIDSIISKYQDKILEFFTCSKCGNIWSQEIDDTIHQLRFGYFNGHKLLENKQ